MNNTTLANNLYPIANGTSSSNPFVDLFLPRDPNGNDIYYPIQKKWLNTTNNNYWMLVGFTSLSGVVSANWIELDSSQLATSYVTNSGTAHPAGDILNVLGSLGVTTVGSGNTVTVSVTGGGFAWVNVTSATQVISVGTGYITDHTNVTYTLPATAGLGDTFIIVGKLGITTIAQNANQQILISASSSTVGVTGSVAGTNVGDGGTFVCITAGASTVWRSSSFIGNWTVT